MSTLRIRGARTHNLKNIDLDIPLGKLVAITGRSGSGKSSLAFDTIYVESLRRYFSQFSGNERQRVKAPEAPDLDVIEGVSAVIALPQMQPPRGPTDTVGTFSEIHNALAMLYAAHGTAHCIACQRALVVRSLSDTADHIAQKYAGEKTLLCVPLRPTESTSALDALAQQGFVRVRIDGALRDLPLPKGAKIQPRTLDLVVDRLVPSAAERNRIADSVALAFRVGKGVFCVETEQGQQEWFYERNYCWHCDRVYPELRASLFLLPNDFTNAVTYREQKFGDVVALHLPKLKSTFHAWSSAGTESETALLQTTEARIARLISLNLGHLELTRPLQAVSTGEFQRLRFARLLDVPLRNALYVLDEPSLGHHASERAELETLLQELGEIGAGVIMVEHDRELLSRSDYLIALGPGPGEAGGRVLAAGPSAEILSHPDVAAIVDPQPATRAHLPLTDASWLEVGAAKRATKIPLQRWTCLAGKSGSGKSRVLAALEIHAKNHPSLFKNMLLVDGEPVRAGIRSLVITYLDAFTALRQLFAGLPEARARGWSAAHFGLLGKGGRCEACEGTGFLIKDSAWLESALARCDVCLGRRYTIEVEQVRYRGASIADFLAMSVEQALTLLEAVPVLSKPLRAATELGLGYVALGQTTSSLSGGEAQRLQFAHTLGQHKVDSTLVLFDMPSRGLAACDLPLMINVLSKLVEQGATLVTADHNASIIASADHVINLSAHN